MSWLLIVSGCGWQVDALRPGLLTNCRQQFSIRYCNRRLIPTLARRRDGGGMLKYHHSGCSHASELHALLKQVAVPSLPSASSPSPPPL